LRIIGDLDAKTAADIESLNAEFFSRDTEVRRNELHREEGKELLHQ